MDGGVENMWLMDYGCSWPESLYGSPTSLTCFRGFDSCGIWLVLFLCAWRVGSCEIWLVALLCACLVLMVIPFLIACSLMSSSEIWWISWLLFMWVGMSSWTCSRASMLVHEFILLMLLLVLLMLVLWEPLAVVSLYHTRSFLRAYISRHASYKDSMTSFMNQILHLANPHDKLSTFVLYPHLGFLSIHRLTPWDPRLGHLGLLLGVIEIQMVFICLIMAFNSTYYDIFTFMWAFSYILSLCLLEMWIALVLSWSHSMYHNRSNLYLAFCAAWFVRRLWSASIILYLLLMRLDLFTILCHSALVVTHVCSIMVFVSSVDVTFSWLVSTPVLRRVALVIHIFLVVDGEWVFRVIIDDYSRSCGFCA
jgi:hypothetical protein